MGPVISSIMLAMLALPVHAQLYRWVDANGTVTYSTLAPRDVRAAIVDIDPAVRQSVEREPAPLDALGITNKAGAPNPYRDATALAHRQEYRKRQLAVWRTRCHAERHADCADAALEERYQRAIDWMIPGTPLPR